MNRYISRKHRYSQISSKHWHSQIIPQLIYESHDTPLRIDSVLTKLLSHLIRSIYPLFSHRTHKGSPHLFGRSSGVLPAEDQIDQTVPDFQFDFLLRIRYVKLHPVFILTAVRADKKAEENYSLRPHEPSQNTSTTIPAGIAAPAIQIRVRIPRFFSTCFQVCT